MSRHRLVEMIEQYKSVAQETDVREAVIRKLSAENATLGRDLTNLAQKLHGSQLNEAAIFGELLETRRVLQELVSFLQILQPPGLRDTPAYVKALVLLVEKALTDTSTKEQKR